MVALDATTQTLFNEELGGRVKPDHGEILNSALGLEDAVNLPQVTH
jgi:hypothetical protein